MRTLSLLVGLPEEESTLDILSKELEFDTSLSDLAKSLFSKKLPPLATPSVLPYLFGVSHQLIGFMETFPHRMYRIYEVPKSSGGTRQIEAPRRFLKLIQEWIYEYICSKPRLEENVNGFVRGKSIFSNATVHTKNKNLMVVDVSDFFPSVKSNKVEAIFQELGFPPIVSHQLTNLCCLDGHLPQGAPTSPALANLVFRPVDTELISLSRTWQCDYTRYADDLAFSGFKRFSAEDEKQVEQILFPFGFSINPRKSRIIGKGGRQIVAGLVINSRALPPRIVRRKWRATFHRASKHPSEFRERMGYLFGVASFINQYSKDMSKTYRDIAQQVLDHHP
jgi:RNA-directed DNA polymerase